MPAKRRPSIVAAVVLDTTADDEIVGIEIFDTTERFPVKSLSRLEITGKPSSRGAEGPA
jgi:hypothetical protein